MCVCLDVWIYAFQSLDAFCDEGLLLLLFHSVSPCDRLHTHDRLFPSCLLPALHSRPVAPLSPPDSGYTDS